MRIGVHGVVVLLRVEVLGIGDIERTTAVLVTLELGDSSFGCVGVVEADDTGTAGAAARLILDLGLLNLADSLEQLNEVLVAR